MISSSQQQHQETAKRPSNRPPVIIYASRTHSQLSQVVRELRNTRYRPKHAVLGSREQMCVNPKVKKATSTASEINHECSKMGLERKCRFKNKLDGFQAPATETGAFGTQPVMDMEDMLNMGKTHKVCPFYYTRSLIEEAELVLVPYNYLFDKDARTTTLADVPWDNAVIIFDEAHNLESFASESASFDLSSMDIGGCIQDLSRAMGYIETLGSSSIKPESIITLKGLLLHMETYVLQLPNQNAYLGEFMMEIFEKGASINHANHQLFINEVRKVSEIFMEVQGGSNGRGAPRLDHFVQCVKRVFGEPTEARCLAKAKSYRVHITPKATPGGNNNNSGKSAGRTISYWCFAPSEAMRELANLNVRSILVTSGTLSPLESYALELGLPFPHRLENPHIIPHEQIHVRVVGKGVSGKLLSSSYERRQDAEYYTELGNTLVSLAKVIPGGMLIFFPSYGVMESCMERWGGPASSQPSGGGKSTNSFFAARQQKSNGKGSARYSFPFAPSTYSASKETLTPWKRLLGAKAVVVEPKTSSDLPDAISEFHKHLNLQKSTGCALFGVCRGKISEGIDFANDMCRAVIITGLPFAPSFDPKVKMKREFLDGNRAFQSVKASGDGGFGSNDRAGSTLSGHEWYTQQAHRAVNQAIGRVIRNRYDYGAVLLLDSRFGQPRNQDGLSKWVRPHIKNDEGVGCAIRSLVTFYKSNEQNAKAREKAPPAPVAPNDVAIILRYEEEGKENSNKQISPDEHDFTNVAIIRKSEGCSSTTQSTSHSAQETTNHQCADSATGSYIPPEMIVARLDVNSLEGSQVSANETSTCHNEKKPKSNSGSLAELYASSRTASRTINGPSQSSQEMPSSARKPDGEDKTGVNRRRKSIGSSQNAVQFFKLVQSRLSSSAFSSIKKSLVAMKNLGDEKDKKSYLQRAREIIRIIVQQESFDKRRRDQKPEMLELLFLLLPETLRQDAQRLTMVEALDHSALAKLCKTSLSMDDWKSSRSFIAKLLFDAWYDKDGSGISTEDYLRRAQEILSVFLKADRKSEMMRSFSVLMPLDYFSATSAVIDELKATQTIRRIKETEKSQSGENSLQSALFLSGRAKQEESSLAQHAAQPTKVSQSVVGKSSTHVDQRRLGAHTAVHKEDSEGKKRPNPYARKSTGNGVHISGMGAREEVGRAIKTTRTAPLNYLLAQSESSTFLGKAGPSIASNINSNAPKDLTCQICFVKCAKVCSNGFSYCACCSSDADKQSSAPLALYCQMWSHSLP
jgi:regulator of telomere elongation helicase 1